MKKILILSLIFSLPLISGCEELCDTSIKNVTEYIGSWTCVGKGNFGEIKGYANCKTSDGWTYNGDVWGHVFHGKGKLTTSEGQIQDGYFNNGNFVAGKVTFENGNSGKGLWSENGHVELGKFFYKKSGNIEFGEFDDKGIISYGMRSVKSSEVGEILNVGSFKNDILYNGYVSISKGCFGVTNGNLKEITRTITNTVYRNVGVSGISSLTQLGSMFNPYNVNVTIK